jgi:hypothetical protein
MNETNEPTFFEQLQLLLVKLNEAFPVEVGCKNNITLSDDGHVTISVWGKSKEGNPCSWFVALDNDEDELMSFDDVAEVLLKYAKDNAK